MKRSGMMPLIFIISIIRSCVEELFWDLKCQKTVKKNERTNTKDAF